MLFLFLVNFSWDVYAPGTTTLYLVRHAEKACDDCATCGLSSEGTARAELLADYLMNKGIDSVFASQCLRTQHTAQPLAQRLNKSVNTYQTTQLNSFISSLSSMTEQRQILIVGHSNQIPMIVDALTDETVTISETDYDNLFIVKKKKYFGASASLKKLTYGVETD